MKPPQAKAGFFSQLYFDLQAFLDSFSNKYNLIGNIYTDSDQTLEVWAISGGRDQLQIVKSLIDDVYTPNSDIGVNLSLVTDPSTLTQAILGGRGPDAAIMVPRDLPVNLAFRGALAELSDFPGFEETVSEFFPSALIPYVYEGGIYALPEVQSFLMMFARTDIFEELGIEPPNTWDEFYNIIPYIQKRNMTVGIPSTQIVFETLIFQNNGEFYTEDRRASGFNHPDSLKAFEQWTSFYTEYGFPVDFDLFNRFRTGEMPLGFANVSFYNLLTAAAPELRNLWKMYPLPGTVNEDGSINRQSGSTGMGCVVVESSSKKELAYDFLNWWVSSETQTAYGIELENVMGPLARYETANKKAFEKLPWTLDEASVIMEQWEQVSDVLQLPGNYFTNRNIIFAFRSVVNKLENPREVLKRYTREIDAEILRKRREFGLE